MHALPYVQSANLKLVSEFPYNYNIISQSVVAAFAASKSIHDVTAHAVTFSAHVSYTARCSRCSRFSQLLRKHIISSIIIMGDTLKWCIFNLKVELKFIIISFLIRVTLHACPYKNCILRSHVAKSSNNYSLLYIIKFVICPSLEGIKDVVCNNLAKCLDWSEW